MRSGKVRISGSRSQENNDFEKVRKESRNGPRIVPLSDVKEAILHGAIRIENVSEPDMYIPDLFDKVGAEALKKAYKIEFEGIEGFYGVFAKRFGKMIKGGEPNIDLIAKTVKVRLHYSRKFTGAANSPEQKNFIHTKIG